MNENKSKSLENLLSMNTTKFTQVQFPIQYETYRSELHHEMAKHWPFDDKKLDTTTIPPLPSKSIARSTISNNENSQQRFRNLIASNSTRLSRKKTEVKPRSKLVDSQYSLNERQKRNEWNLKAQEGIITYRLPDSLPDGLSLHAKLQKLMKTNTINLNDRHFWTTLENRFKKLRKENFRQNMERLRQNQQQHEQELIAQGVIPHTTEEAIKQAAEQHRTENPTKSMPINKSNHINCLIDSLTLNDVSKIKTDDFEIFESDNVHPNLHEIFTDYEFQTDSGKELTDKLQDQLHQTQIQIKSIFPKANRRDLIQQELEAVKTSEGLYAYSNRLAKQRSK